MEAVFIEGVRIDVLARFEFVCGQGLRSPQREKY